MQKTGLRLMAVGGFMRQPEISASWRETLTFLAERGGAVLVTQITSRAVRDRVFGVLLSPGAATIRNMESAGLVETTVEDGDWTPMVQVTDSGWAEIEK